MIKSCYIHIPFCDSICSYCDFCKMFYEKSIVDRYLETLEKEIRRNYNNEVLDTIYIGGGTPSALSLEQLKKLFNILSILKKSNNIEYTIENNFENINIEKLKLYKEYGINRLSFGVETINRTNLKLLNRTISKNKIKNIITEATRLGFNNINVDLMYAIPNETKEVLKCDLDYIFSLNVSHISTYSLMIEENTILKINKVKNICETLDYEMYKIICTEMKKHGYNHYEISNFSKPGKESLHNLCYWNNKEYYGFGLGASSYINNKRITNTKSIQKYLKGNYIKDIENLSKVEKQEYEIILNLRKKEGISLSNFKNLFKIDLKEIYNYQSLIDDKVLKEKDGYLFIPEKYFYISNKIICDLLRCEVNE